MAGDVRFMAAAGPKGITPGEVWVIFGRKDDQRFCVSYADHATR